MLHSYEPGPHRLLHLLQPVPRLLLLHLPLQLGHLTYKYRKYHEYS